MTEPKRTWASRLELAGDLSRLIGRLMDEEALADEGNRMSDALWQEGQRLSRDGATGFEISMLDGIQAAVERAEQDHMIHHRRQWERSAESRDPLKVEW